MPLRRKPFGDQPGIGVGVDQVARRRDLRARHPARAGSCTGTAPSRRTAARRAEALSDGSRAMSSERRARRSAGGRGRAAPTGSNHRTNRTTSASLQVPCRAGARTRARAISRPPSDARCAGALLAVDRLDRRARGRTRPARRGRSSTRRCAARTSTRRRTSGRGRRRRGRRRARRRSRSRSCGRGRASCQAAVGVDHLGHDPGAALAVARRRGAGGDDAARRAVDAQRSQPGVRDEAADRLPAATG